MKLLRLQTITIVNSQDTLYIILSEDQSNLFFNKIRSKALSYMILNNASNALQLH